jgi:signal transduction histidine kinase
MAFRLFPIKKLDLQIKIILILIAVILPTSFLVSFAQSRLMAPLMDDELKQVGISFAQTLASRIEAGRWLTKSNAGALIEDRIQSMVYSQPSIMQVDVFSRLSTAGPEGPIINLASSIEGGETQPPEMIKMVTEPKIELSKEDDSPVWSVQYPVKVGAERAVIRVLVSLRLVGTLRNSILRFNLMAGLASTVVLILLLTFFLRRAIENEKQLQLAQVSNEQMSGRLQIIQQELIQKEKLAVMGQLTASFAHEIGTPLNAVGGHLQLLQMDLEKIKLPSGTSTPERIGIITNQLNKIEKIVKQFLRTTKNPVNERRSVVSAGELLEGVLTLVMPTLQRYQISFGRDLQAKNDQIEVVPIEIEQVILNLLNNSIDALKNLDRAKAIWIRTRNDEATNALLITIEDSGEGISKENLKQIFKPFFTTKPSGEGHGLGLSICQEIIRGYHGDLTVSSKINQGTVISISVPVYRSMESA